MKLVGFSMGCADVEVSELEFVILYNALGLCGAYPADVDPKLLDHSDKVEGLRLELKAILRKMEKKKGTGRDWSRVGRVI
jgi:hypothetical protein